MAAIPYSVAEAFFNKKKAKSGAFESTGSELYSYALRIAHWSPTQNGVVYDLTSLYRSSVTTSKHIKAFHAVAEKHLSLIVTN